MRKIGKRTRATAIHALLQCSDLRATGRWGHFTWHVETRGSPAQSLASLAHDAVVVTDGIAEVDAYLEAAALLLDGWSPGDPVYLLSEVAS